MVKRKGTVVPPAAERLKCRSPPATGIWVCRLSIKQEFSFGPYIDLTLRENILYKDSSVLFKQGDLCIAVFLKHWLNEGRLMQHIQSEHQPAVCMRILDHACPEQQQLFWCPAVLGQAAHHSQLSPSSPWGSKDTGVSIPAAGSSLLPAAMGKWWALSATAKTTTPE